MAEAKANPRGQTGQVVIPLGHGVESARCAAPRRDAVPIVKGVHRCVRTACCGGSPPDSTAPPRDPRPHATDAHHHNRHPRDARHRSARSGDPAQQRRALGPFRAHDRRGRDQRRLHRLRRDGRRRRGRRAPVRGARRIPARPRRIPARGDALRDLQSDREPLQQPHPAPRRDRVRLPRHHGEEARRARACAAGRKAARARRVRELSLLPLRPSRQRDGRSAHGGAARRARPGAQGGARLSRAQAQGRRLPAGARARLLPRARRGAARAIASATTRTARCRSPTRSPSDRASRTSPTIISRIPCGACRSSRGSRSSSTCRPRPTRWWSTSSSSPRTSRVPRWT